MFLNMNMNMNMNMNKIKYILFFNKIIDYIKPTRYYYLRKNSLVEITLIIWFLNITIIGYLLQDFIFDNKLYSVNNEYIKNVRDKSNNILISKKIIKSIKYIHNNNELLFNELKLNIYKIHPNVLIIFLLLYFQKSKLNENCYINIEFMTNKNIIQIFRYTKFKELFI